MSRRSASSPPKRQTPGLEPNDGEPYRQPAPCELSRYGHEEAVPALITRTARPPSGLSLANTTYEIT